LTHVAKRADDHDHRHDQQQAAGSIIGPTMMIMMVLSLTVEPVCNRSRRPAISAQLPLQSPPSAVIRTDDRLQA
jgi:hypothetical protein